MTQKYKYFFIIQIFKKLFNVLSMNIYAKLNDSPTADVDIDSITLSQMLIYNQIDAEL